MNWCKYLTSKSYRKHRWAARNLKHYRVGGKLNIDKMIKLMIMTMVMVHILESFLDPFRELRLLEYEEAQLDITR